MKSNKQLLRSLVVLSVLVVVGLVGASGVLAAPGDVVGNKYEVHLHPPAGTNYSIHRAEFQDGVWVGTGEQVGWGRADSNDSNADFDEYLPNGTYFVYFEVDPDDQGQWLDTRYTEGSPGPYEFWAKTAVPAAPEEPVAEPAVDEEEAVEEIEESTVPAQYVLYATALDVEITAGETINVAGGLRDAEWKPVTTTIYLELDDVYTTTSTTAGFMFSLPYETAGTIQGKLWAEGSNQIPVVVQIEPGTAVSVTMEAPSEVTPGELLSVEWADTDPSENVNPTSESYDVTASIGGDMFLTYNDFAGNSLQFTCPGDVGDVITIEVEGDTGLKGTTEVTLVEELEEPVSAYTMITIPTGATLSGLATMFGTSVEELMRLNGIPNPDMIIAGKPLIVPVDLMGGP